MRKTSSRNAAVYAPSGFEECRFAPGGKTPSAGRGYAAAAILRRVSGPECNQSDANVALAGRMDPIRGRSICG